MTGYPEASDHAKNEKRSNVTAHLTNELINAARPNATVQSEPQAHLLEEEATQKEEAQNEDESVNDDFDKTHEINYAQKSQGLPSSKHLV